MKILVTGMNTNQTTEDYFLRQEVKVVPSHYSLLRCLRDMGHQVEQRHVEIEEDLSGYDEVIIFLHSPKGFCQRLYSGLWALHARPNAVLAFDDWQVDQILFSIKSIRDGMLGQTLSDPFKAYLIDMQNTKYEQGYLDKFKKQFVEGADVALAKSSRLLISAFKGGDLEKLNIKWRGRMIRYNPNPYHLNRKRENNFGLDDVLGWEEATRPEDKKREWNFASLVQAKTRDWIKTQGVKDWPINYYGAKKGEFKCPRLTEDEMCEVFEKQWGCLMPGYFHSGSGWWRARPLQVADAGSILVCDPAEGAVYGGSDGADCFEWKASEIETMTTEELTAVAADQKYFLYETHPLDKAVQRAELQEIWA
jgi:hypothetical protein